PRGGVRRDEAVERDPRQLPRQRAADPAHYPRDDSVSTNAPTGSCADIFTGTRAASVDSHTTSARAPASAGGVTEKRCAWTVPLASLRAAAGPASISTFELVPPAQIGMVIFSPAVRGIDLRTNRAPSGSWATAEMAIVFFTTVRVSTWKSALRRG